MNGKSFIDTNILVYAYDSSEKIKHDEAFNLLERLGNSNTGVISLQVLSEFFVVVTQKIERPITKDRAIEIVKEFIDNWEVYEPSTSTLLLALDITVKHKLSFWDSLIVASAKEYGAGILYSEDFQHNIIISENQVHQPICEAS